MKKFPAVILAAGLMLGVAAGCSSSSNDNGDELRSKMVESGATEEQADCILQGFKDAKLPLSVDAKGTSDQTKKATEITMDCVGLDAP